MDSISIEILNRLNEKEKLLVFKQKTSFESNAIINKFLTKGNVHPGSCPPSTLSQ